MLSFKILYLTEIRGQLPIFKLVDDSCFMYRDKLKFFFELCCSNFDEKFESSMSSVAASLPSKTILTRHEIADAKLWV